MIKLWIVYKQWTTGKVDRVAAYFSEGAAREHASNIVGQDNCLIGLETIEVMDDVPSTPKPDPHP